MSSELVLALIVMLVGLVGSLLPMVPGPPLIWLGAVFYAWSTGFAEVGWGMLLLLFAIMLIAATSDFWVSALRQRQAGVSLAGTLLSMVLGLAGLFTLGLPGMLLGSIVGAIAPDYLRYRDWRRSLRLSRTTLVAWALSAVVQFGLGLVMIIIFLFQVWAQ